MKVQVANKQTNKQNLYNLEEHFTTVMSDTVTMLGGGGKTGVKSKYILSSLSKFGTMGSEIFQLYPHECTTLYPG